LALLVLLAPPTLAAQVERTDRDRWQKVAEIFAALGVEPGERIADVGAGSGFLTLRLSPVVGPAGRVIAVDIDEAVLGRLRETARAAALDNVETVVGAPDDPRLSPESVDGVLIVNAYHEMTEYTAILTAVRRALRPGGRLVIVDTPPSDSGASREQQMAQHDIAIGIVARDLETNGFTVVQRVPDFVDEGTGRGRRRNWLLAAVVGP
jgi:ubiquinone/menaquinone biosynthesis C-methylase UbiE